MMRTAPDDHKNNILTEHIVASTVNVQWQDTGDDCSKLTMIHIIVYYTINILSKI